MAMRPQNLPPLPNRLRQHKFQIRQKVLSIGNKYFINDGVGNLIGFCKQKVFKLKEDIRIYKTKDMNEELFRIKQENIVDFSGTFQVIDSKTGRSVGFLKRKGFKSMIKDEWDILDPNRNLIGKVKEDSWFKAFIRRYVMSFLPYKYKIYLGDKKVGDYKEKFTFVRDVYDLDVSEDRNFALDRRLLLSIAICLDAIENE
ncbi:MAG: LURP-one-related/scramblase family protein [Thermoplasmatota archaeon]